MKNLALSLIAILVIFSSFSSGRDNQKVKKEIEFYSMNYAFVNMKLEVITPSGKVYTKTWEYLDHDVWMKSAKMKNINFPIDGKNCKVRMFFKTASGDTCIAHFLLNDYDYSGHALYVMISSINFAPKLESNFGPGEYGTRLVNQWSYPLDDYAIHPHIKRDTPIAKNVALQIARYSKYMR